MDLSRVWVTGGVVPLFPSDPFVRFLFFIGLFVILFVVSFLVGWRVHRAALPLSSRHQQSTQIVGAHAEGGWVGGGWGQGRHGRGGSGHRSAWRRCGRGEWTGADRFNICSSSGLSAALSVSHIALVPSRVEKEEGHTLTCGVGMDACSSTTEMLIDACLRCSAAASAVHSPLPLSPASSLRLPPDYFSFLLSCFYCSRASSPPLSSSFILL